MAIQIGTLKSIEKELLAISSQEVTAWYITGKFLYTVQEHALFKQENDYTSFSNWLCQLSIKMQCKQSKLWKILANYKLLLSYDMNHSDFNHATTALEVVCKQAKNNFSRQEIISNLELIKNKKIKVKELKDQVSLKKLTVQLEPELEPSKKNFRAKLKIAIYPTLYILFFLSLLTIT